MSYETITPIAQRTDVFDEYINEELKDIDTSLIKFNEDLNTNLFDNFKLKPSVRKILIRIFDYFISNIEYEFVFDKLILTGSIVNFNYNKNSDIDLHIIIDKKDYNTEEEYNIILESITTKAKLWNYEHENIKLFNHNIEIYLQDSNEVHNSSGIYDIISDEWILKPSKQNKDIDKEYFKKKLKNIVSKIETVIKSNNLNKIENIIDNIKLYRKIGLDSGGEYSYENLIFKYIKYKGYMDKLYNIKRKLSI